MSEVKYLIFDIETVGDGDLIRKVRFPDEPLNPREAIQRYRSQLLEESGRDVLPLTFVLPVSVAVAKVSRDWQLLEVSVLDAPQFRPQEIVRRFWQGWSHYKQPTLVTFNGRSYDLPVMEVAAFRFGISIPQWFNVDARSFEQARNRYNQEAHIDLQDLLTNYGAFRMSGAFSRMRSNTTTTSYSEYPRMVSRAATVAEFCGEVPRSKWKRRFFNQVRYCTKKFESRL